MKYCKKCVTPNTSPGLTFDEEGVCYVCRYAEKAEREIDWNKRKEELLKIVERAKKISSGKNYEAVIGVSGGKDTTFQALYAKEELGLNVLLVNVMPDDVNELGRYNIENLYRQGFDMYTFRHNPLIHKELVKRSFYRYGNIIKPSEYDLYAIPWRIALAFKIPLVIHGENPATYVGDLIDKIGDGSDSSTVIYGNTTQGGHASDWVGDMIEYKDVLAYEFPSRKEIKDAVTKGIYLSHCVRWSQHKNAEFSMNRGLKIRQDPSEDIGQIGKYSSQDHDTPIINQMLKHIKLGYGFATDEASRGIREGRLRRTQAIELVRKYDGKCAPRYIETFCKYIDNSVEEFWRVANSFRGEMWAKDSDREWRLVNPIWEQEQ